MKSYDGKTTCGVAVSWVISGQILEYLNAESRIMSELCETALLSSTQVFLTVLRHEFV